MRILLRWTRAYPNEDSINVYRSTSTMNPLSLPAALASGLASGTLEYEDATAVDGVTYYYRVESIIGANNWVSEEIVRTPDASLEYDEQGIWFAYHAHTNALYALEQLDMADTLARTYYEKYEDTNAFAEVAYEIGNLADTGIQATAFDRVNKVKPGMEFYFELYLRATAALDGRITAVDGLAADLLYLDWNQSPSGGGYGVDLTFGEDVTYNKENNPDTGIHAIIGFLQIYPDRIEFHTAIRNRDPIGTLHRQVPFILYNKGMKNLHTFSVAGLRAYASSGVVGYDAHSFLELVGPINVYNAKATLFKTSGEVRLDWDEQFSGEIERILIYRTEDAPLDIDDATNMEDFYLDSVNGGVGTYTDITTVNTGNYFYHFDIALKTKGWRSVQPILALFQPHTLASARLAHYTFETLTSGVCVDSWGSYTGQAYGTYALTTGETGNGIQLDGSTAYVDTLLDLELGELGAWADREWGLDIFFKLTGDPTLGYMSVLGRGGGNGTGATFCIFISDGVTGAGDDGELVIDIRGSYTRTYVNVEDGNWHYTGAYFKNGKGYFRLDDQVFDINIGTAVIQAIRVLTLGATVGGGSGFFGGDLDSFRCHTTFFPKHITGYRFANVGIGVGIGNFDYEMLYNPFEVKLTWEYMDEDLITAVIVYRSATPIDTGSLPAALATLGSVTEYTDSTIAENTGYYYLVDVQTSGPTSHFSTNRYVKEAIGGLDYFSGHGTMFWYDISDLSTLWQDTSGTIAVTKDGDPVLRIDDKGGASNNAIIDSGSGTYRTDGRRHWIEFDGATGYLNSQIISGTVDRTLAAACVSTSPQPSTNPIYNCGHVYTAAGSGTIYTFSPEDDGFWIRVANGNEIWTTDAGNDYTGYRRLLNEWGLSFGTLVEDGKSYDADVLLVSGGTGTTQTIAGEVLTNGAIGLMENDAASQTFYNGQLHQLFVGAFLLTATEQTLLDEFLQTKDPDNLY